jgi:cobalt/nickel transport system ATP-binding protein
MTESELLRVENISYRYDDRFLALDNVSVCFRRGETVAVLGGNGAGKSTFFLCLNGVLRPQSGSVFLNGKKVSDKKKDIYALRQAVGLVFQDPDSQIIAGSVESEVSFGPMNLRLPPDEVKRRVDESLEQMNIGRYKDFAPQYLSGGEKKRVSIADILAMRPEMILFDEPTASLDPQNTEAFEEILSELSREGITIVISTHDVNFAWRVAERAIVFSQGGIIADADTDEVFEQSDILERAGLKKPLLLGAFELMQAALPDKRSGRKPRTIDELREYCE